ncbi:MAG: epoxyqueuosine reductase QueH [Treponema sp.]|jgi:predicted adenine nucleotide alpha hydrolase (AANH) superfamily ATPase|nr:epoxyqueuosine reductase QueH [Treponema sp.]
MKLLLHVCCAPCSVSCIASLRDEGIEPALFWYNPNIHPFGEYKKRRDTLLSYAASRGLEVIIKDQYGLRTFLSAFSAEKGDPWSKETRCAYCYRTRLEAAARAADENGFDAFSTTLLVSPYQNHALICKIAESQAVPFLYRDFRPRFREGQKTARETGLYMQKYCGCIFSEEEAATSKPGG